MLHRLNEIEPHLRLLVRLGQNEKMPGVAPVGDLRELGISGSATAEAGGATALALAGLTVQFVANNNFATPDYGPTATSQIKQYDKDNNNYLDLDEVLERFKDENQRKNMKAQFSTWDIDSNGMVFADEIKTFYERTQLPISTRVSVVAREEQNKLFSLLDTTSDGRISLREMRDAPARIRSLDNDGDGILTGEELPNTMTVTVSRGNANAGNIYQLRRTVKKNNPSCPPWFTRMDKNADGDISPREFPGTPAQFTRLDANGDGFIDTAEGIACSKNG